ncbi:unnamed protein product [Cyclocybe aegerita]|uniref:Uncharacterized protein n=1 Tax=Cyclocybe aegerita TaxID=1973307 RepID=A0A8S0XQ82_CYCAE|nr:unnamed protein product [Cyclocybe aegerita]
MGPHDHLHARTQQQQQQQHREALRLALGSILASVSPSSTFDDADCFMAFVILNKKRPPFNPPSRSSSGACTPAFGMSSGAHTPANTPPVTGYYPLAHGPNSSEYLHPHHAYQHHGHAPLPPSRLGRSSSSNSPTESAIPSSSSSAHPSPRPGATGSADPVPLPFDLEPLPPAAVHATPSPTDDTKPVRPSISPLHSDHGSGSEGESGSSSQTGAGTPRAKFLQTLQSKSAWDALIHGSFS